MRAYRREKKHRFLEKETQERNDVGGGGAKTREVRGARAPRRLGGKGGKEAKAPKEARGRKRGSEDSGWGWRFNRAVSGTVRGR